MLVPLLATLLLAAPQTGRVTFVISVSDPSGTPLSDVKVTMTGPAQRTSRTEAGRLVFEGLPAGAYHFRFERQGFEPLDKDVTGRGSAPVAVKAAMTAVLTPIATKPVPSLPTPGAGRADSAAAHPVVLDMPAFIEKNYVGHANGKVTPLGCGAGGTSTLIQINEGISTHTHADADEFIYVIAGQGSANMPGRQEPLGPGVFLMLPRGLPHGFTTGPKKPLVMISTRAGEKCAAEPIKQ